MSTPDQAQVTRLLDAAHGGDEGASEALWAAVHQEIRQMAAGALRHERPGATLQPTMVVSEIYLRMWPADAPPPRWEDRKHFFGSVARVMGQFLVDHARTRSRLKRGGDRKRMPLEVNAGELARLDSFDEHAGASLVKALEELEQSAPRQAEVAWLRYIAGLSLEQTAEALDISPRTVTNDWQYAQAWLRRALSEAPE